MSTSGRKPAANRRQWSRMPAETLPNVKAALKSGVEVELVNLSRGGAQFRTPNRLLPGLNVSLKIVTTDGQLTVQGKVMRSSMVRMQTGALGYEVGIAFEKLLMGAAPAAPPPVEVGEAGAEEAPAEPPAATPARAVPPAVEAVEELIPINGDPGTFEVLDSTTPASSPRAGSVSVTANVSRQSLDGLIGLLDLE